MKHLKCIKKKERVTKTRPPNSSSMRRVHTESYGYVSPQLSLYVLVTFLFYHSFHSTIHLHKLVR